MAGGPLKIKRGTCPVLKLATWRHTTESAQSDRSLNTMVENQKGLHHDYCQTLQNPSKFMSHLCGILRSLKVSGWQSISDWPLVYHPQRNRFFASN